MSIIKLLPISIGAIALTAATQIPAHAGLIGGQVTGTWSSGGSFIADYTYDDSAVVTTDNSIPSFTNDIETEVPLLSLVLTSTSIRPTTYSFDLLNNPMTKLWTRLSSTAVSGGLSTQQLFRIEALDADYSLTLVSDISTDVTGTPSNASFATLFQSSTLALVDEGGTSIQFSSTAPVAIPTPMLLPGLIGFGVSLMRKKRQEMTIDSSN
jgi:hypothetical protein